MVDAHAEQVQRAGYVRVDVDLRVLHRLTDTSPCGQVENSVELVRGKQLLHGVEIGDIPAHHAETLARLELLEPPVLQSDIVRVVQVVDADDYVTALQEQFRNRGTNEPAAPVTRYRAMRAP
jgi:hypothetical protein